MVFGMNHRPPANILLHCFAMDNGIDESLIVNKGRTARVVRFRNACVKNMRYYGYTQEEIGWAIKRDASTICHSIQKTGATIGKEYQ